MIFMGSAAFVDQMTALIGLIAASAVGLYGALVMLVAEEYWPAQKLWGPRWYSSKTKEEVDDLQNGGNIEKIIATKAPEWAGQTLDVYRSGS